MIAQNSVLLLFAVVNILNLLNSLYFLEIYKLKS